MDELKEIEKKAIRIRHKAESIISKTHEITTEIHLRGRGFMCMVPGCDNIGFPCVLDCFDDEGDWEGEGNVRLCEKHLEEARSAGQ